MANATSGTIAGVSPVIGSQAPDPARFQPAGGNVLPQGGKTAAAPAATISNVAKSAAAPAAAVSNAAAARSNPQSLVDQVNKYLNDSGRPDQFRVDPASDKYIQQVNPATGAVVGEYLVSEFPALARSVGVSGLLIDDIA